VGTQHTPPTYRMHDISCTPPTYHTTCTTHRSAHLLHFLDRGHSAHVAHLSHPWHLLHSTHLLHYLHDGPQRASLTLLRPWALTTRRSLIPSMTSPALRPLVTLAARRNTARACCTTCTVATCYMLQRESTTPSLSRHVNLLVIPGKPPSLSIQENELRPPTLGY
jgi:hypothetical protein